MCVMHDMGAFIKSVHVFISFTPNETFELKTRRPAQISCPKLRKLDINCWANKKRNKR